MFLVQSLCRLCACSAFLFIGCTPTPALNQVELKLDFSQLDADFSQDLAFIEPISPLLSDQGVDDQETNDQGADDRDLLDQSIDVTDSMPSLDQHPLDQGSSVESAQVRHPQNLPYIYDLSQADPLKVDRLIQHALDGLGFDGHQSGPQTEDRIFVNRFMIGWIDETGFYGKLNGLWLLNGDPQNLDFVIKESGRPVNSLIVGEFGRGLWPSGYVGAEHFEYPNPTPEEDDDPQCAQTFCAQYSLNEAAQYTNSSLPTWQACNEGSPSFSDHFEPLNIEFTPQELIIKYKAPITKEGDFGGSTSGNHCHEDYLFPDGVRRPVYLELGWHFTANDPWLDRILQVDNPEGNPSFRGANGFVGGFVFTRWPNPHPKKQLQQYLYVPDRSVEFQWTSDESLQVPAQTWFRLPTTRPTRDVVLGWARQAISLSGAAEHARGLSFTQDHLGLFDTEDTGFCLCTIHGGIEMGGGLIHSEVLGGMKSHQAIRRLYLEQDRHMAPSYQELLYQAETDLSHQIGQGTEEGWQAIPMEDEVGFLVFGPYAQNWGEGQVDVQFQLRLTPTPLSGSDECVLIEVYDADQDELLAQQTISTSDFESVNQDQPFTLSVDLSGRLGHRLESRIYWLGHHQIEVDYIQVHPRSRSN